jgi:hypothetical protein
MATVRRSLVAVCALVIGLSAAAAAPRLLSGSPRSWPTAALVAGLVDTSPVDDVVRDVVPAVAPELRATARQSQPDGRRRLPSPWSYIGVAAVALVLAVVFERTRRARRPSTAQLAFAHHASRAPPGRGLFVR